MASVRTCRHRRSQPAMAALAGRDTYHTVPLAKHMPVHNETTTSPLSPRRVVSADVARSFVRWHITSSSPCCDFIIWRQKKSPTATAVLATCFEIGTSSPLDQSQSFIHRDNSRPTVRTDRDHPGTGREVSGRRQATVGGMSSQWLDRQPIQGQARRGAGDTDAAAGERWDIQLDGKE